ncbi:MAG: 2-oxo-hepta-3-ene-1,7-dioic acid hydratase [Immundisolibacteraceae bacterium]|jgi:2-oxo-hept-3-ene-1,7-dioate hydratase|nr:2-oxo-hepta-3-ene-1,7-dioic acid hydratase [Immundisolibacteraceae bacterium]
MLDQSTIEAAAQALHQAEKNVEPMGQLGLAHPGMTIDDGYAIQQQWTALKLAEGRRVVGRKIGLTSRAMQQMFNLTEPDYGTLFDDQVFAEGSDIPVDRFIVPMVEVELAFYLGDRLSGENVTVTDVLRATEYVSPAVELIDARTHRIDPETGKGRQVTDTIADNAACAGIIAGGRPVPPDSVDLRWVGAMLSRNGVIEETGLAGGVLNHPANGIVWLARRFAKHGIDLEPGQVILCGSFTRPVPVRAGDTFHLDYGELGSMGFRFV